jgi:formylglycine-generating enzyme required for sulfatase activity
VGATAAAAWNASLACGTPASGSWTSAVEADENLPITCVDWYAASAFCIWDGGFVPSDAEWEYVAVAGSQERPFPWGSQIPWLSPNRVQYAIFDCDYGSNNDNCSGTGAANIAPVGTAILGAGYWGQLDMLGNTEEWTQDWVDDQTPHPDPCNDCGYLSPASTREARGGNFGTPVVWNSGITAFRPTVALDCGALGCLDPRVP